ncbi:MAG: hypothetical protein ACREQ2_18770 [Candidatus Binatia bacterium]
MAEPFKTLSAACAGEEENLVLLHYGDLAGAERDTLQSHLNGCAACKDYLQDLGKLLPLTLKTDEPPQTFWADYKRELRHKLDHAAEKPTWRQKLAAFFQPRLVPLFVTAAVVALALTFTLGRGLWTTNDPAREEAAMLEVLPVAENLEFFRAMDVLDDLELLEFMGSRGSAA